MWLSVQSYVFVGTAKALLYYFIERIRFSDAKLRSISKPAKKKTSHVVPNRTTWDIWLPYSEAVPGH